MGDRRKYLLLSTLFLAVSLTFRDARADETTADSDPEQVVQDLYTQNKLFTKTAYKTLRKAFAHRFEQKYQDTIKQAYGAEYDELTAWLNENSDLKEEFYTAIDEHHDNIEAALRIFKDLFKHYPDKLKAYGQLAIATAVVWDDPSKGVYDYKPHQVRTKSTLPSGAMGALENFQYIVDHEKVMQGRGQYVPWEFLVYVVNHQTPLAERKWALENYLFRRGMCGQCYQEVPYDHGMLQGDSPKLAGKAYTLENIRKCGGVCAMQADFAARVGKSLGVPAEYVGGEGNTLVRHAWVMWVELKQVSKNQIAFSLESFGRYNIDQYYTGQLRDPQTGLPILDRDMELRLGSVGLNTQAKRHANLVMRAYPLLCEKLALHRASQLKFLQNCLTLCPYNEEAWFAVARLAKDGQLKRTQAMAYTEKLFKTFAGFPDFTWKVFDDLMAVQKELPKRIKFYERLVALYERAGRPDLACEARLKLVEYQVEAERWQDAAVGLAFTIQKFPAEGRYVPRMMDKLEEVCKNFKGGDEHLMRFYLNVLPHIPPRRGNEPSKYCISMHEKAIAFFKERGQDKVVAELEQRLAQIRAGKAQAAAGPSR